MTGEESQSGKSWLVQLQPPPSQTFVPILPLPLSAADLSLHLSGVPLFNAPTSPQAFTPLSPSNLPFPPFLPSPESPAGLGSAFPEAPVEGFPIELVWKTRFAALFANFAAVHGHQWSLSPATDAPGPGWLEFHDDAKIRFDCYDCGNGWTSMKGRVVFWYALWGAGGAVLFKLLGQRCRKCDSATFQKPLWYPREVEKVVWNVYNKVCETVYGVPSAQAAIVRGRREGKPQKEHVSTDCEACSLGICSSGNNSKVVPK